jgi:calcium-dependent protein kinase
MEECKGGEIFDRIIQHIQKKEMYSEKDAATIFQQVMSAIEYCHNNGICHRDLKPENILYLNEGAEKDNPIKVIDFGLSQVISSDKKLSTKVGTAYYVSPEILLGEYTEKCDIWSAGVILYIFLSGDPPFNGSNDHAIYTKISKMKFTFPEKKWKNISNEAKDLISHMITPEKERYTARQVLSHPWFSNASTVPLSELNFDSSFFVDYEKSSELKKMTLLFIASRLDENEINNLKKSFEAIDNSKDGQITFEELKSGLIQLKSNKMNENEIKELFDLIDVDQNGKIDYTEFLAATLQKKNYLRNERLLEAFCMFDKDNSGQITKDELLQALKAEKSQEKEVEKYIQAVDKNGDGKIDYKEFLDLMGFQ